MSKLQNISFFSSSDPAVHLLDSDDYDPGPDYVRRPDETVCAIGEQPFNKYCFLRQLYPLLLLMLKKDDAKVEEGKLRRMKGSEKLRKSTKDLEIYI